MLFKNLTGKSGHSHFNPDNPQQCSHGHNQPFRPAPQSVNVSRSSQDLDDEEVNVEMMPGIRTNFGTTA